MVEILEQEKFVAAKELADIGVQIAAASAVLQNLKDETAAYLDDREKLVIERIQKVLKESNEALQEVTKNHDALKKYGADLTSFAKLLKEMLEEVKAYRATVSQRADSDAKAIEMAWEKIAEVRNELHAARMVIEADRLGIDADRKWITEEKIRLADERATLERAIARGNK